MSTVEDLDRIIEQLVNLGEMDPLGIARKIIARQGEPWVAEQLALLAEDLVAEMARKKLGSARRSAEIALQPGDERADIQMRLAKFWIPGEGWKPANELTVSDLRKRADWYRVFSMAARQREAWCREVADMMEAEAVETLGKLKAPLPALPDAEAILALPEAI